MSSHGAPDQLYGGTCREELEKAIACWGGMPTSVNRALDQPYPEDFMVRNAFTAGIDFGDISITVFII